MSSIFILNKIPTEIMDNSGRSTWYKRITGCMSLKDFSACFSGFNVLDAIRIQNIQSAQIEGPMDMII